MGESRRSFLASLAALVACPVPLLAGPVAWNVGSTTLSATWAKGLCVRAYVSYDAGTTWSEGVPEVVRTGAITLRELV